MLGKDICKLKFLPESSLYFKSVSRFKRFDDLAEIYIFNINRVNVLGFVVIRIAYSIWFVKLKLLRLHSYVAIAPIPLSINVQFLKYWTPLKSNSGIGSSWHRYTHFGSLLVQKKYIWNISFLDEHAEIKFWIKYTLRVS